MESYPEAELKGFDIATEGPKLGKCSSHEVVETQFDPFRIDYDAHNIFNDREVSNSCLTRIL